jgi:hypothetical protein
MPKPPEQEQRPRSPSPSIDPVLTWPTPGREDLLFFVERNGDLPENKQWQFGDSYRGRGEYPDHKLVYVSPQSPEKWSRWFYASDRINQEAYNFEFTGDQLTRSFLIPREKYFARTRAQADAVEPTVIDEFVRPVVGTADTRFGQFVYAEDSLSRTETELDSLYVLVRQAYVPERLISYQWDEVLQRTIRITRQVVPAQTQSGSGTYGTLVEIQPGNIFHDFKITSEVVWEPGDLDGSGKPKFPIQIDSIAADANYQFPLLLKSIELYGAWAYAFSEAPPDYAEDFFFEIDLVEPAPGPYDATVLRFVTDNPDVVRAMYPTTKITTRAETFGMVRWWASSHNGGNRAFALARQYNAPASAHGEIELPASVNYVQGGSRTDAYNAPGSKTLPATPGYDAFRASSTTIAGVDTRRSRLGLWEVQVTIINAGGGTVYSDDDSAQRIVRPGTGSSPVAGGSGPGEIVFAFVDGEGNASTPIMANSSGGEYTIRVYSKVTFAWFIPAAYAGIISSVEPLEITPTAEDFFQYDFKVVLTPNLADTTRQAFVEFYDPTKAFPSDYTERLGLASIQQTPIVFLPDKGAPATPVVAVSAGGAYTIKVRCYGTFAWTIPTAYASVISSVEPVEITPTEGNFYIYEFTVIVAANSTGNSREAFVLFYDPDFVTPNIDGTLPVGGLPAKIVQL